LIPRFRECVATVSHRAHLLAQGLEIWDFELEQVGFGVMHLEGVMRDLCGDSDGPRSRLCLAQPAS
jgi:hypothetical protein